ncbi:DUF1827 family protein [Agrilactobacillus fermenti]|uniref:DUF1827 family protein n=1 Tax=Agrilactobacillus fermenti TaxID=2586909 RepID=UPI001E49E580|nr:DUF1827 family protein [Agrilactobacillus fermenti]MCD2255200.1 DUF1827 family protein [Agrilactobacillus fermenti]
MKLMDITTSYRDLVQKQLDGTDANYVKVYSMGATTIVYTKAPRHQELLLTNDKRNITQTEIDTAIETLVDQNVNLSRVTKGPRLAEVSIQSA